MSSSIPFIVDVHSHIYPPSYISLLASHTTVPYIHIPTDSSPPRLIILPSDDDPSKPPAARGRPIDSTYSSWNLKRAFMLKHNIRISVVSLANPWLDFLPANTAAQTAEAINSDLDRACADFNSQSTPNSQPTKLYAFGTLPLSAPPAQILTAISHLCTLPHIRGVILGTTGLGSGLDSPSMDPIYSALESTQTLIFLHPHYGLPSAAYGPGADTALANTGHVLPLALGFPLETTIAFTRAFLAGVFDRFPRLRVLLAHSGGTVPFLAGRIESCVVHEREFVGKGGKGPRREINEVLKENVWLDAVIYGSAGLKAAVEAVGSDRVMFGTDHPFFPPVGEEEKGEEREGRWLSVDMNVNAIRKSFGGLDGKEATSILGGNAVRMLGLEM